MILLLTMLVQTAGAGSAKSVHAALSTTEGCHNPLCFTHFTQLWFYSFIYVVNFREIFKKRVVFNDR